jgi:hypothetical protein
MAEMMMMMPALSPVMKFEEWLLEFEDNLLDVWMHLQDLARSGIRFFDKISFYDFCTLVYAKSTIPEAWVASTAAVATAGGDDSVAAAEDAVDEWP